MHRPIFQAFFFSSTEENKKGYVPLVELKLTFRRIRQWRIHYNKKGKQCLSYVYMSFFLLFFHVRGRRFVLTSIKLLFFFLPCLSLSLFFTWSHLQDALEAFCVVLYRRSVVDSTSLRKRYTENRVRSHEIDTRLHMYAVHVLRNIYRVTVEIISICNMSTIGFFHDSWNFIKKNVQKKKERKKGKSETKTIRKLTRIIFLCSMGKKKSLY